MNRRTSGTLDEPEDAELDAYKAELDNAKNVPEQLFGDSFLRLSHTDSGVCLEFTALDALHTWRKDDRPPVRVGAAEDWLKSRQKDVEASGAVSFEYDWTYTTSYKGTLRVESNGEASVSGRKAEWVPTSEQMDRSLLMARDPILFFDEVPLYESELDDNGASQLAVKVRVMPECWFVLLRFWLRVDRVLVRLYETRYMADFRAGPGQPQVTREVRCCEGTFNALHAAGAPPDGPAYKDADSASTALQAAAPIGVTEFRTEKLQLSANL
ncbi:TIP41-domain-containing protein [Coccomyxa subellipsoidea C-169]|uniref:TIP41-domain-containing protein n=1 Tax=Coccomyxa subellipsoidea (strain C-169) TaxID=574566 RepID=I0YYV1_COCSC|nr:TIP41-domain-containing protein [Coccomyxa subellipsoidea C-169]EIE23570.1 TIP41-domain-containing protein [Coccomyxa subellipsoidea C-169]|eukprot:XP_005648114.1 TIP41-domain-containing protein [Coccomyxa subellipsoidea C-169]